MADRAKVNRGRRYADDDYSDSEDDAGVVYQKRAESRFNVNDEDDNERWHSIDESPVPSARPRRPVDRNPPPRRHQTFAPSSDDSQEEDADAHLPNTYNLFEVDVDEFGRVQRTSGQQGSTPPLPGRRTVFTDDRQRTDGQNSTDTDSSSQHSQGQRGGRNAFQGEKVLRDQPPRGYPRRARDDLEPRRRDVSPEYTRQQRERGRQPPAQWPRPDRREQDRMPNAHRNRNYPQDERRRGYQPWMQHPNSRGRARRSHPMNQRPHQNPRPHQDDFTSEEEDSDDSIHERRPGSARDPFNQSFSLENEITPESLMNILDKKRDLRATLLHLLENYDYETFSVRQVVSANPNLFRLAGETVELKINVKVCSAHNGSKGCLNRSTCRDLHICSKYIDHKCRVDDCVMGHSWVTRHNTQILKDLKIQDLSERSLESMLQSSLSLSDNMSHNPLDVCSRYNQGTCRRRDCYYLHVCLSFVSGRSKCSKQQCKLNHDLLTPDCCRVLEASGIDVNESPRDVLLALLEANPALKKKQAEVGKSPSTQNLAQTGESVDKPSEKQKHNQASNDTSTKNRNRKKKNRTTWSYYPKGDVDIVEICYNSVESLCTKESTGCQRLHALKHFHWQVSENGTSWLNFQMHQATTLEHSFCDVNNDGAKLPRFDLLQHQGTSNCLLVLLGRDSWTVDFNSMKITDSKKTKSLQIRRLCTEIVSGKNTVEPSSFVWYFLDKQQNWVEYGKVDSVGETTLVSSLTSDAIETQFLKDSSTPINFKNAKFNYTLDFKAMTQTNQHTQVARDVRRRPQVHLQNEEEEQQQGRQRRLPSDWDQMKSNERLKRVAISSTSEEYQKIIQLLGNQIPVSNVTQIERVQNRFHWNAFQNKTEEMASLYGDMSKVNIRQLFHGTKHDVIPKICSENFDPRLHGLAAGQAYGQGTYFASGANLSYGYCKPDSSGLKYMFVAQVAVGSLTLGNSSMPRPPINSSTGAPFDSTGDNATNPSIIVKYDKAEYYPQYIFTLK